MIRLQPSEGEGARMHDRMRSLFPICRSITGDGVRETLRRIGGEIPLKIVEVPTGTAVFDWTVPKEWNIRGAWILDPAGRRIVDFRDSNLHVVGYSIPVRRRISKGELEKHLHSDPEHPDWIPYRTSYYREDWGFCLADRQRRSLPEGEYEICIDSTLEPGSLTYGECFIRGAEENEVLVSVHVCHPSLGNDNLSGITVAVSLARILAAAPRRRSYRFLFIPGTIGSITWLARNEERAARIRHGLVLAGVGDPGAATYKRSRRGDASIDRAVAHVLRTSGRPHEIRAFSPYGYDERQYGSPGFDLPVGCLMRTPFGEYPQYHTSADDLDFVRPEALEDSLRVCLETFEILEGDRTYLNLSPKCEPQLGRRGLYGSIGGSPDGGDDRMALLWTLNLSDGRHSLLEIGERSGMPFASIAHAAERLVEAGLLREIEPGSAPRAEEKGRMP